MQPNLKGIYQDEVSAGFDMLLDPSFSVGVKGMYRNLGNTIEDRCDLDGTSPLTNFNTCAIINPGSDSPLALGQVPGCNGLDGLSAGCFDSVPPIGKAKRTYWGGELVARKQFTNALWAQASVVYSSLRGNYDGEVREGRGQTDPGINADFDYFEFQHNNEGKLFLDVPWRFRLDATYTTPFKLYAGLTFYLQSGAPLNQQGYFNAGYGAEIQLVERGIGPDAPGALRDEPDARVSARPRPRDDHPADLHVQPPEQAAGDAEGRPVLDLAAGRIHQLPAVSTFEAPCTLYDPNQQQTNANYNTFTQRQAPRLFRFALKVSF